MHRRCWDPRGSAVLLLCFLHNADFLRALGRTRTCDLLIRSHSPSATWADMEGQGETQQRFYRVLAFLEGQGGTGRDTRLRSDCGQTRPDTSFLTLSKSTNGVFRGSYTIEA